jgi:hypothetical protein
MQTSGGEAHEGYVPWTELERDGLKPLNESPMPLYLRTRHFRNYSPDMMSGALQTADYTRAVLRTIADQAGLPDDVDAAVAVRVDRQRLLYDGAHRYSIVLEEAALRYPIGGTDVMTAQLRHLSEAAALDSVSLGIVPLGCARTDRWPVEGFWIFDDTQVDMELAAGSLKLTQPREVALYADTFDALSGPAVYGAEAEALIADAIIALE